MVRVYSFTIEALQELEACTAGILLASEEEEIALTGRGRGWGVKGEPK
jgi:hypothetical protein